MIADTAFAAWKQRAGDFAVDEAARRLGAKLRKVTAAEWAGPCPRCGGTDRFSVNLRKGVFNCRGSVGGDVIRMVEHVLGVDFLAACEWITGEPPPDRDSTLGDAEREALARAAEERAAADARRESDDNVFRERERGTLYDIWRSACADAPELASYFALRLGPAICDVPRSEWPRLRCVRDMPYYRRGDDRGEIFARAPAMVAPLIDATGRFRGLHFTYLDLSEPNGKLRVTVPETGEALPAKKVRGSKQGHWIDLFPRRDPPPAPEGPRTLVLGEGIEKTLAVWLALRLAGRDLSATAFWVAADLGNLAGKAAASVRHPTQRHEQSGRPVMVAGPEPHMDAPAIVIPDGVDDLVLLGDSTSDPFATCCALARATKRYARPGRRVRTAWAPDGVDFDELFLREAA